MNQTKRQLGSVEYLHKYAHDNGSGSGIILTFVRITGHFNKEQIINALHKVCQRHPVLRAHLESKKCNYLKTEHSLYINQSINQLPVKFLVKTSDNQWKDIVENELQMQFAEHDFLWKIIVLLGKENEQCKHDFILKFHHVIMDGLSVAYFFRDFLNYYNNENMLVNTLPFMPSVETLLKNQISWPKFLCRFIFYGLKCLWLKKYLYSFDSNATLSEIKTKSRYQCINENQTSLLLAKCREEKVTLTGLLNAALMIAVYRAYNNKNERQQIVTTPVSMRTLCDPPLGPEHLGCLISYVRTMHLLNYNSSLWELARQYKKQLTKNISIYSHFPSKFSSRILDTLLALNNSGDLKTKFRYGLCISNIGSVDFFSEVQGYSVDEVYSCTSHALGEVLMTIIVASINNKIYLTFTHAEPLLHEKTAILIQKNLNSILNDAVGIKIAE
jgi:hypothetical protein